MDEHDRFSLAGYDVMDVDTGDAKALIGGRLAQGGQRQASQKQQRREMPGDRPAIAVRVDE